MFDFFTSSLATNIPTYVPLFSDKQDVCRDAGFQEQTDQSCQQHCNLALYLLSLHISPATQAKANIFKTKKSLLISPLHKPTDRNN